jgi:hypothetical protein
MNLSGKFGSASTIWYPGSGFRGYEDGRLHWVGEVGYYWSASPTSSNAYTLSISSYGISSYNNARTDGQSVRCIKETE